VGKTHRIINAIVPPDFKFNFREALGPPHPECLDVGTKILRHCNRCIARKFGPNSSLQSNQVTEEHFIVIPLDSCTVQCRTCALEHGTSQRMCAVCFDEEDTEHKSRHDFFRVWQKLDNAIDPKNRLSTEYQIRLSCKQCPDLGKTS
jgi:hypothetical protein